MSPHPLTGHWYLNHMALPHVGYMNQEYVFTERLNKYMNIYNNVLKDMPKK